MPTVAYSTIVTGLESNLAEAYLLIAEKFSFVGLPGVTKISSIYESSTKPLQKRGHAMAVDIKETLELIQSASDSIDTIEVILEDGEVNLKDIRQLPKLISELKPGLVGIGKIKAEIQDMDKEEMQVVLNAVIDLGLKIATKFGV